MDSDRISFLPEVKGSIPQRGRIEVFNPKGYSFSAEPIEDDLIK
jgi:hypothetical protein